MKKVLWFHLNTSWNWAAGENFKLKSAKKVWCWESVYDVIYCTCKCLERESKGTHEDLLGLFELFQYSLSLPAVGCKSHKKAQRCSRHTEAPSLFVHVFLLILILYLVGAEWTSNNYTLKSRKLYFKERLQGSLPVTGTAGASLQILSPREGVPWIFLLLLSQMGFQAPCYECVPPPTHREICHSGLVLILVWRQDGGSFILDPIVPSSCQGQRSERKRKERWDRTRAEPL